MGYSTGRKPWRSEPYNEATSEDRLARQKLVFFGLLVVVLFGVLTVQLARMQLVKGDEYRLRAETNRLRKVPIIPTRGLVFDRNGVALVENRASFSAAVVAADIPKDRETETSIALQELLGVPAGDIVQLVE